jgi:beta-1,4-N-acetylglucosaminyltransferase
VARPGLRDDANRMTKRSPRRPPARRARRQLERADVLLVCSAGGHLLQLWALRDAYEAYERAWVVVSHERSDAASLLRDERVIFAHGPTTRSVRNLVRNALLAWRTLGALHPQAIVTTGAAIAVPFAWVGRLRGVPTVYIESLARARRPSLSCRLVALVADRLYVQWPELTKAVRGARYAGTVFSPR